MLVRAAKYWFGIHAGAVAMLFLVSFCCFINLITVDIICILYDTYFFCIYFTDDTDAKTRTWEWLTEYQFFWDSKLQTCFTYFIFEQVAKWLDDFFEINEIRKSAYIMMGFDHCGFSAKTTFYHIRIDGSLCEEINRTNFLCLFFKNTDKFFTDNFTFCLRLGDSGQFLIISLLCVDTDKIQIKLTIRSEYIFNLITFIFTKKTVIHKYTG